MDEWLFICIFVILHSLLSLFAGWLFLRSWRLYAGCITVGLILWGVLFPTFAGRPVAGAEILLVCAAIAAASLHGGLWVWLCQQRRLLPWHIPAAILGAIGFSKLLTQGMYPEPVIVTFAILLFCIPIGSMAGLLLVTLLHKRH